MYNPRFLQQIETKKRRILLGEEATKRRYFLFGEKDEGSLSLRGPSRDRSRPLLVGRRRRENKTLRARYGPEHRKSSSTPLSSFTRPSALA